MQIKQLFCPRCGEEIKSADKMFVHCTFGILKDIFYDNEFLCYDCGYIENGEIIKKNKDNIEQWINSQWLFYGGHKYKVIRISKKRD